MIQNVTACTPYRIYVCYDEQGNPLGVIGEYFVEEMRRMDVLTNI